MKVLTIPDIHLKPEIFAKAAQILLAHKADCAVCLMDLPDDWNRQFDDAAYDRILAAAAEFAVTFPDTLWCLGNHDCSYLWGMQESGYSALQRDRVCRGLANLKAALPKEEQLAYLHRIDSILFCHGGLAEEYLREYLPNESYRDMDGILSRINGFGRAELWKDLSPLWYRPQYYQGRMYAPICGTFPDGGERRLLQVVGHTPVESITKKGSVISTDVFSAYRDGTPIGTPSFLIIDTLTQQFSVLPV